MPLAKYIEHFQSMSRSEQISNIRAGTYSGEKGHLETLLKYADNAEVRYEINKKLGRSTTLAVVEPAKCPPVGISNQLEQAAFLVNHRYGILTNPAKAQSRSVIEIGIIMLAVKDQLPHGGLAKWREENTKLSKSWDEYCRRAAQKFIEQHGQGTAAALIEGSGSNQRQIEQAEQLLMDFTGGKGPAALLHNLGIKKRPEEEKQPPMDKHKRAEQMACDDWNHIAGLIIEYKDAWLNMTDHQIALLDDLIWDTVKAIHDKARGVK